MKRYLPLILLVALFLSGCGSPTTATDTVVPDFSASLTEIEGLVEMKNPDQADFTAAANGDSLQVLGQVRTGADGRAAIKLSTGSIVRVAPSTLFTLEINETAEVGLFTQLKLEAGKLWIVLNGGSIDVNTPSGVATVRGSYMMVWVDPGTGDVWVDCLEGWCQAGNGTATLDLIASQGGVLYSFDPTGSVPPPPPLLRTLTQAEIDEFLANNPELANVMDAIIATASALPGLTELPTLPPIVPSPDPASACFSLTNPANGAALSSTGAVEFTWNGQTGAAAYTITITQPNGYQLTFPALDTSHLRYLESLPAAGTFQWQVTAYDDAGAPLCTAGPFTFVKPAAPTATPLPLLPTGLPVVRTDNATIIYEQGPDGITVSSADCSQNYLVLATDPEGISEVSVSYVVYDLYGWLGSGSFLLGPAQTDEYGGFNSIDTMVLGSEIPFDIYWSFTVLDLQGNITIGPAYHFTDFGPCSSGPF